MNLRSTHFVEHMVHMGQYSNLKKTLLHDWKSDAVVEGYVADSRSNKNKLAKTLKSVMKVIERTINKEISASTSFPPNSGISVLGN